jgi:putative hydrolase of the HAD superfamily
VNGVGGVWIRAADTELAVRGNHDVAVDDLSRADAACGMRARVTCRAVFLDAGGVIVLPNRRLVTSALAGIGIDVDASLVPAAHYRAVRLLDREPERRDGEHAYLRAVCSALGVSRERLSDAVERMAHLADRRASGEILWSEPAPGALSTITALGGAGMVVFVVTNSDGHAADNLRDASICQTGAGAGVEVAGVIDSGLVGSAKPQRGIFRVAMQSARVHPGSVVHVGDMLIADVAGALASGIVPIHLDPHRRCRARNHRHVRSLTGIWRHVAPPGSHT